MNIVTFSSLYPNNVDPSHGIFVERRLRELLSRTDIRSTVISPVPWFPLSAGVVGRYSGFAKIAKLDRRFDIDVLHPRYLLIPKFGMNLAPRLMAAACETSVENCVDDSAARLIDAHYFYPDGVAASIIARKMKLPYCITARGSDINLIANFDSPRRQMLEAARHADALIAVSEALAGAMRDLGMPSRKIHVLKNGVDLEFFSPGERDDDIHRSESVNKTFLSIGALKTGKGHDIAIRFVSEIPGANLVVAGRGEEERALRQLAAKLGIGHKVSFTGTLDQDSLRERYRAADALILMSEREGLPNVILESLACGTPVLATPVGGIPEVLTVPQCGQLTKSRDVEGLAEAWQKLSKRKIDSARIREHMSRYSWDDTIKQLATLMRSVVSA